MPASTTLGIRYPLTTEVPNVAPDMQRLAGDVDGLLAAPTVFAAVRRDTTGTSASTGNIWLTDLVVVTSIGSITPSTGGIQIVTPGWYELHGWARMATSSGTNVAMVTQIGLGGTVIAQGYALAAAASQNWTPHASCLYQFSAGQVIQFGWTQSVASQITFYGGNTVNGLTARLVKKT